MDIYRVYDLFGVTSHRIAHAIKKLLMPGKRGDKGPVQDLQEAVGSIKSEINEQVDDGLFVTLKDIQNDPQYDKVRNRLEKEFNDMVSPTVFTRDPDGELRSRVKPEHDFGSAEWKILDDAGKLKSKEQTVELFNKLFSKTIPVDKEQVEKSIKEGEAEMEDDVTCYDDLINKWLNCTWDMSEVDLVCLKSAVGQLYADAKKRMEDAKVPKSMAKSVQTGEDREFTGMDPKVLFSYAQPLDSKNLWKVKSEDGKC